MKKLLWFFVGVFIPASPCIYSVLVIYIEDTYIHTHAFQAFFAITGIIILLSLPITYLIFAIKNGKTLYLLALPIGYAISPIYSYWYEYVYRQGNSPNWGGSPLAVGIYIYFYTIPCLVLTSVICATAIYYHWQKKKHRTNLKQNGDG